MKYKTLSIVIPVYNEGKFIEKAIKRVVAADSLGLKKEIIIVNDGSTDQTFNKLRNLETLKQNKFASGQVKKLSNLIIINKKKNEGKGAALKEGFLKSTGDIVLVQDADLEYNPNDYPLLLKPFLEYDADVVYGSRFVSQHPKRVLYFWHYVANIFLTTLSNMFTNLNITDMETGYKAFKGELIRKIAKDLKSKRFGFEPEITAKIAKIKNIKIYEVGISYQGRTYEEGKKIGFWDALKAVFQILRYNIFS